MIELYHSEPSTNSGEVLICLHEKGIDFVGRYVDVLTFEQFGQAFLEVNPDGQVPVLVHDGEVLTQTGFILQYLDAEFPTVPLTPHSAQGRYWLNVWIKYVNEYMAPALWRLGVAQQGRLRQLAGAAQALEKAPIERRDAWRKALDGFSADELEIARALLPIRLARMEQALAAGDWLAGPAYSLADIMVFPTALGLAQVTPDLVNAAATPRILDWIERMRARPAVEAALATARRPETVFVPGPEGSRWG